MEHISPIFIAAFAAALFVFYAWGKLTTSFKNYIEYRKLEQQKRFHHERLAAFLDAARDIDDVITRMNTAMPSTKRRESLTYADFGKIREIQTAVDRVVEEALALRYSFQEDLGIASDTERRVTEVSNDEAERIWGESFDRVKAKCPDLTRSQYRRELEKLGIFSARQLVQAGPMVTEKRVLESLVPHPKTELS